MAGLLGGRDRIVEGHPVYDPDPGQEAGAASGAIVLDAAGLVGVGRPRPNGGQLRLAAVAQASAVDDEAVEQRVRALRPGLELGVELAGDEPRVVAQLDDLDEAAVGRHAGQEHARALEGLAVAVVHLEPVAVPLVDDLLAVHRAGLRARQQLGRVEAEAHRAALVLEVPLVGHEVDDRVGREHVELGRVDVARSRGSRARTRSPRTAGRGTGRGTGTPCSRAQWAARTLPSMPRWPKPPGHEDARRAVQALGDVVRRSAARCRPSAPSRRRRSPRPRASATRSPTGRRRAARCTCRRARSRASPWAP